MCRGILPLNELFKGQTSFVGAIVWVVVDMSYLEACLGESTGRWLRRGCILSILCSRSSDGLGEPCAENDYVERALIHIGKASRQSRDRDGA